MMKMNDIRLFLSVISLLLISCSSNEDNVITSGKIKVAISVTLPEPEEVHTRAYTDKDIKNMTVLLFDHTNKFMERIDVDETDITTDANGIKFNIVVDATPDNRTLHLIANARTADGGTDRIDLSGVATTKTEAQIIPNLTTKVITGTGDNVLMDNIGPLMMWGRVALAGVNVTTVVNDVKLLRSVACVRVKKKAELADFIIKKIAIHNGVAQGYVAPSAYTSAVTTNPTAANPYHSSPVFDYTKAWSAANTEPFAYIYERNCTSSDYMSVILSATYKGKAGYYRIALADGTPVNILRNHRYTITILSVNGPGYESVTTAASSAPANNNLLKVEVNVDTTQAYPYISADSQHWMGTSNNVFQLIGSSSGGSTSSVELCSVYSSRGIAPVITNQPAGLTTSYTGSGNEYKVIGTFANGASIANQAITITCDNLSLPLNVQWANSIESVGSYDDDSYVLDFVNSLNNWKVWIPAPTVNNMVHLHPTAYSPDALTSNKGSGMVTELAVDHFGHAYLHINKTVGHRDEVWTSALSNGNVITRKTVIAQD